MAHWLDEAAAGLSEGRYNRRQILRRSGAAAGGALLASVTWPITARAAGVPCPDFDSPCFSPDICCGDTCLKPSSHLGCCHGSTYDPREEKCCPHGKQACFNDETCCGQDRCCAHNEICCGDTCFKPSSHLGCCHDSTYDPREEKCCPHGKQACFNDETCCGQRECCSKGHHCVTCGSGKKLCCPDGEYCCNGVCCKPKDCKHGVCVGGNCGGSRCPPGQACCNPRVGSCVTLAPAGDWHLGNYDGAPNENVFCCPGGSGGTCGNNPGESHPACQGGNFGCVCSSGTFCPVGGCCDIFGACKNPC
jgi:hypothetical protein